MLILPKKPPLIGRRPFSIQRGLRFKKNPREPSLAIIYQVVTEKTMYAFLHHYDNWKDCCYQALFAVD